MNTSNSTSEYLFLFRGTDWDRSMSPAEMQQTMSRFQSWFERMSADGTLKAGQPLLDDARVVSGKSGRTVTDGPFPESKEAIGGYAIIKADSFEDAVEIARQCPIVEAGVDLEVRPLAVDCPTLQRVRQRITEELATAGV